MKQLIVRVEDKVKDDFTWYCKKHGYKMNKIVELMLIEWMNERGVYDYKKEA